MINKVYSRILVVMLFLTLFTMNLNKQVFADENLIKNGSFDNGNIDEWQIRSNIGSIRSFSEEKLKFMNIETKKKS